MIHRLWVLLFVICFIVVKGFAQRTQYIVIIVVDGARYTETFGDSTHSFIPFIWGELAPQGVVYSNYYNDGKTQTNPGHASILSGVWQYISNDGSEYSHSPSIFEYIRSQKNIPEAALWVALGKDKLNVLAHSSHPEYGAGASVRTSLDPSDDALTMENVRYVLLNHKSRITIANFAKTDIEGHAGSWENYTGGIKRADSLIAELWRWIQADPTLKNKTTMIVTNDHGRHTTDFVNHGDGCEGCRHIMLMILGPDTPKGIVDPLLSSQIDIAKTVAKMMRFSAPLAQGKVLASAVAAASNISLSLTNAPAGKISGDYLLQWSAGASAESLSTLIEYSNDGGTSWNHLHTIPGKDSSYLWNTKGLKDGTRYRIRIEITGDTTYGTAASQQNFTIDNPGNGAPDIQLTYPDRNVILSGTVQVQWEAADAEGDQLTMTISGSTDNGVTWLPISAGLQNTGSYSWQTEPFANSKSFRLKITCYDDSTSTMIISTLFEIENLRKKAMSMMRTVGNGNGIISANVCLQEQLTGDAYRVSFSDGPFAGKRYSIRNMTKNIDLLSNIQFPGDGSEGPLFDGLRLAITDYPEPVHNPDSTLWTIGNSPLFVVVNLPEINLPDGNIQALPEAADYEIRISGTIVDTSKDYLGAFPTPMYFTVVNTTTNHKVPIVLTELSPDGKFSFGDDLYFFMKDSTGKEVLSWELFVNGEPDDALPLPGDIFRVATTKPITSADVYEFVGAVTSVPAHSGGPGDFSLSQNYPNPFNPSTTIRCNVPIASHLRLELYDVLGRRVNTYFDGIVAKGPHTFVIDGSSLSSGTYFLRMTASGVTNRDRIVSRVLRMVLMR